MSQQKILICKFDILHLSLLKYTWLKVVKKLAN